MNHGLVLISPMILVRLLSVEEFGWYREFLLYATVLASIAGFNVNTSLMRFVAHQPAYGQQFVEQALLMTLASTALVLGGAATLNVLFDGAVVGRYMLPIAIYVIAFVNFDFWEHLWLAQRRAGAVFAYTSGRLIARMTVVIVAAALTGDVMTIIWSLVTLEAVRMIASAAFWLRSRESRPARLAEGWSEQLRFCAPVGAAMVILTLNRTMGGIYIAKALGPVALAHYAIGTYVQPLIGVLRNSLSDALLPEMSSQQGAQQSDPLWLWRRTTIAAGILLIPAAIVLARFAETIVITLFSAQYAEAVPVFQIYLLVLVREVIDFAVPLRAINQTKPILYSNILSIIANAALLIVLLPRAGIAGAAAAFVIARVIEGVFISRQTARAYSTRLRELVRWRDLGKVALAAGLASISLIGGFWDEFGLIGAAAGGACFLFFYAACLLLLDVPEALLAAARISWPRLRRAQS